MELSDAEITLLTTCASSLTNAAASRFPTTDTTFFAGITTAEVPAIASLP
jgi:hypothetical protein